MSDGLRQTIITIVIILVIVILLILGIRFAISALRRVSTGVNVSPRVETTVTVNESSDTIQNIQAPEEQYSGRIKFTATVERVLGVRAFVIRNSELFKDDMLIISQSGIAPIGAKNVDEFLIKPGDRLVISGEVGKFDPNHLTANVRQTISTINLTSFTGSPVIVASDIDRIK